jgi:hypothetical protein
VSHWLRSASGRVVYAIVLGVLAFSTLEQFSGLNQDLSWLPRATFHWVAFAAALGAALFEATTLRGLAGLRHFLEKPDPIASVANRRCAYRFAHVEDLESVRALAIARYGWAFKSRHLRRWHDANPKCLFLMLSEGELVGYLDAFPISAADYRFLLEGGKERKITPLRADAIDADSSFYVASVVVAESWGGRLPALLKRGATAYGSRYADKAWRRVCAIGYSPEGRKLLERKEMKLVTGDGIRARMYALERADLAGLSRVNRVLWLRFLPE